MFTKEKISAIFGYIVVTLITIVIGSFAISFIIKQSQKCDAQNIGFCTTKDICEKSKLNWWNDRCNIDAPKCNKDYINLCDNKEICEKNNLFWWGDKCSIEQKLIPKSSEYPDYYNIKGDNPDPNIKPLLITKDCPKDGCINKMSAIKDFDGIKKDYKISGSFSRAYLYIEAMVDYNRPLSIWDDVYFNIFGQGGHLIPDGNILPTPASDSSIYLYDMRSISYFPEIKNKESKTSKQINKNLFTILKDGRIVKIHTSLSSDRPGRVLKEVAIYFECAEGSECNIEEINIK